MSDPDKKLIKAAGCLAEQEFLLLKFIGVKRTTFILDEKGKIQHILQDFKISEHVKLVHQALDSFTK